MAGRSTNIERIRVGGTAEFLDFVIEEKAGIHIVKYGRAIYDAQQYEPYNQAVPKSFLSMCERCALNSKVRSWPESLG